MPQAVCLAPDCGFVAEADDIEAAKRQVIDHTNVDCQVIEAQVIIACAHDLEVEKVIDDPKRFGGVAQELGVCKRCGNRVQRDKEG